MRLPVIRKENRYKRQTVTFGGLNLMQSFSEGELRDCTGISHLDFPAITQRQKSEAVFLCESPSCISFGDKECIAASGALYYDRKKVCDLSDGEKQIAFLGNRIVVFPDKIYYDTKTGQTGDLQAKYILSGVSVTFTETQISVPESNYVQESEIETISFPAKEKIVVYPSAVVTDGKIGFGEPSIKALSALVEGNILRERCDGNQYRNVQSISLSEDGKHYEVVNELVTVKNTLKDVFSEIREGDVVEISGCSVCESNNKMAMVTAIGKSKITFSSGTFTAATETANIIIQRKVPDFTCICSYQNRIWGCEGNTIYASALGDATNFFVYNNLSTDSFTVESSTAGEFTACVVYGNGCLFFKENSCFKLFGNRPANFTLSESFAGGILKGNARSIAVAGGKLFYKGNGGIFAFSGGSPVCISQKLSGLNLENCVGGSDSKRYYITGDSGGKRQEYIFDIEKSLWSKSGISDTVGYGFYGGNMYRLTKDGVEKLLEEPDETAEWSITLCPFDEGYHKTKNYSRLYIHARLFDGAYIKCQVRSDDGLWKTVSTNYGNEKKHLNIPCIIKNCHEAQLRISGKGKSQLESIVREFSIG